MPSSHDHPSWLFSRTGVATLGALAILGFLTYTGHGAHLLGLLPYLLLFACPLMHIFMHGGHHHGNHSGHGGCCGGGGGDDGKAKGAPSDSTKAGD